MNESEFNGAINTMYDEVNKLKTYCKTYRYFCFWLQSYLILKCEIHLFLLIFRVYGKKSS